MPTVGCTQENCTVATSGLCLDGLRVEECPHYLPTAHAGTTDEPAAEPAVSSLEELSPAEPSPYFVNIPYGDDLDSESARRIMRRARTNLIVLAGDVNSGKTTILAAIYERFVDGPFAGFLFAGSETLVGFERRCHPSRIASEEEKPDTDRTPRGQTRLVHLRLTKASEPNVTRDILFSDISGEDFESARDSVEFCQQMPILRRADCCLLLVDAERLASMKERRRTAIGAEMLLRSFLDSGMLNQSSSVDVLFTKYDKVFTDANRETVEKYIDAMGEDMARKFGPRLGALEFHRVAARPETSEVLAPAFGLDKVLHGCAERREKIRTSETESYLPSNREFDRFLDRRPRITSHL